MSLNKVLWIERPEGAAVAHRACLIERGRKTAAIALLDGSGARREVPAGDLVPAAPLGALEEAEYQKLDRQLAGTIGDSRKLRRFNALRLRSLLFPAGSIA